MILKKMSDRNMIPKKMGQVSKKIGLEEKILHYFYDYDFTFLTALLVSFVSAQNETTCAGFRGSISCFLWGNPSLKPVVGEAFGMEDNIEGEVSRGNLAGMTDE